jgi:hypothetical protein
VDVEELAPALRQRDGLAQVLVAVQRVPDIQRQAGILAVDIAQQEQGLGGRADEGVRARLVGLVFQACGLWSAQACTPATHQSYMRS